MLPHLRRALLFLALLVPAPGALSAQDAARVVPDVRNRTLEAAQGILADANLQHDVEWVAPRRGQRAGIVVRQTPGAGERIQAGGTVALRVTRAPDEGEQGRGAGTVIQIQNIAMPDVRGMTEAEALDALRRVGLPIVRVDSSFAEGQAPGRVVSQRPSPGSDVIQGTPSRITLARSSVPSVAMPNLVGQPLDRARRLLERARLGAGEVSSEASTAAASRVLRQSVPAGQRVAQGTAVALVVSTGQAAPTRAQVPDLNGRTLAEARALLAGASLTLGAADEIDAERVRAGTIFGQQPAPGASVPIGSAVTVAVARPRLATVPRVTGLARTTAEARLRQAGLRPGTTSHTETASRPADSVIGQSIAAGTRVAPGTAVGLNVAVPEHVDGPPPEEEEAQEPPPGPVAADTPAVAQADTPAPAVAADPPAAARVDSLLVPRVIGMTLAEARKALADAGFTAKADAGIADSVRVETQSPEAGVRAARGTAVGLTFPGDGPPVPLWALVTVVVLLIGSKLLFDANERRKILGGVKEVVQAAAAGGGASAAAQAAAVSVSVRAGSRQPEFEVVGNPLGGIAIGLRVRPGQAEAVLVTEGELIANKEIHHA